MTNKLSFTGWWDKQAEFAECPQAWDTFKIILLGIEAGDTVDDPDEIRRIAADSGYEIVLNKSEPISQTALQREGWIHDLDFDGYRFDLGNHTFVAVIIDSRGILTWIARELNDETSAWIEMPGCRDMAKLRALVDMLRGRR